MNRHMRRAAAAVQKNQARLSGINELAGIAEQLQPHLAQIEGLQSQLQSTTQLLHEIQVAITEQHAVLMRMFAQGMGVSLDTVLSMETEIRHALETSQHTDPAAQDSTT